MTSDTEVPVAGAFEREERFIVVKRKHLSPAKEEALRTHLFEDKIATAECVVVESDWPEYETVWRMIEDRVTAQRSTRSAVDETFQQRVQPWLMECFGPMIAGDREERNHRFLEEALELVQACGCTGSEAHQLVDYVYGRPVGEPAQEVGGVMVTLAALCLANHLDMHRDGETELSRIWTKVEKIRAKQAAKPKHSPLPQFANTPSLDLQRYEVALQAIQTAVVEGRVCDDVAWFSNIETLYDFIENVLRPSQPAVVADLFPANSTDA